MICDWWFYITRQFFEFKLFKDFLGFLKELLLVDTLIVFLKKRKISYGNSWFQSKFFDTMRDFMLQLVTWNLDEIVVLSKIYHVPKPKKNSYTHKTQQRQQNHHVHLLHQ